MAPDRFRRIRKYAHTAAFADLDNEADPWQPMANFVVEYNRHMANLMELNAYLVLDETMSPFRPRADKYGGLPHLTLVGRKPKPFGIELKSTTTSDGILTFVEIQKGSAKMESVRQESYPHLKGTFGLSGCCCCWLPVGGRAACR
jgi:hypothetical protein